MNDDAIVSDDELITAVRESFTDVRSATAVEQIVSRSRAVRPRRRVPGVALGAAAAAAAAVTLVLPAGHPASKRGAQLPPWTVVRETDGSIHVSFFGELRDPAGLQRTLRTDGVPASVTFIGQQNPACRSIPNPGGQPPSPRGGRPPQSLGGSPGSGNGTWLGAHGPNEALVINPSALPSGAGVRIAVMRGIPPGPSGPWPYPKGSGHPVAEVGLVQASPQCTGS